MRYILMTLVVVSQLAYGQSIWDSAHLALVKQNLQLPVYTPAFDILIGKAEKLMGQRPVSVMMKDKTAVSGDKHDYLSLSRYFWPDPTKPDGLPYINRDGVSNPELERLDRPKLSVMASGVTTLSLAWYFSDEEKYARKAVEMLRTWFINKDTRMNPHLEYAQIVPGQNGDKGRCYGLIDAYSFVEMLDAVQLLEGSKSFTRKDRKRLKDWFGRFLEWMLNSAQGQEECRQANNHAIAYDVQVMAYARYVNNTKVISDFMSQFYKRRMKKQINPDGTQPQELRRTLAFGYSEYNLSHMIDVFQIAKAAGMSSEGLPLLEKAADFLAQYIGKPVEEWPYQQISGWDEKQHELCLDLYRLYLLDPDRTDYLKLARAHLPKRFSERFVLLYGQLVETENGQ